MNSPNHSPVEEGGDLWPVSEVSAAGLFGDRSFTISLDPVATVLTGQNGSGKSTLLKALNLVAHEQWLDFVYLPLTTLRLTYSDGLTLTVTRKADGLSIAAGDLEWILDIDAAAQLDRRLLDDIRDAPQRYLLRGDFGVAQERMIRERLLRARGVDPSVIDSLLPPEWLSGLIDRFHTKLISARRLEHKLSPEADREDEESRLPVVERYARELRDRMRDALSAYATESRRQEKNLPAQIVSAMQGPSPSPEDLATDVDALSVEVKKLADSLAAVGLLQEEDPQQQFPDYPRDQGPILLAIREVYRVAEERLQRLTGLRSDLELFAGFLNDRLTNKRVVLNQETGIAVELSSGEEIRPSQLSSGEEQLLALAYEILFGCEPKSLVLLDEPELSLHVAWLQGLLEAFVSMGTNRNLQFLIATHSPSVISGYTELERSLDQTPA